ncbi:hypothetical protein H4696_008019 [Amycolatopsis lexingtonensis]|uniref:Uncharacterized protein n=1 Tax=Amycolatopsis lexingtonensis TaxID=218822 RepID=A0ABR9ICL2_9PSEU|nr:hypothetical protein [Amycolatopsis lexingtonensis]MBE1500919.1 hypothetical protein [Amycolatopsis lexingtonensis]
MPRNSRKTIVGKHQENAELAMNVEFFKELRRSIEIRKSQSMSTLSKSQDSVLSTY